EARHLVEEPAQRQVLGLLVRLAQQQLDRRLFAACGVAGSAARSRYPRGTELDEPPVQLTELHDGLLVLGPPKSRQRWVLLKDAVEPGAPERLAKHIHDLLAR